MTKKNQEAMEWFYSLHNGIYQFTGYGEEVEVETKLDPNDGNCRELWERIKRQHPYVTGYKSFCETYRDATSSGWEARERDYINMFGYPDHTHFK